MKAPKNFYNTVDQNKLGIDDLFTRTAENEADITAIEEVIENLPEITPVEANPSNTDPAILLNNIKIGETMYRVHDIERDYSSIKYLRLSMAISENGQFVFQGISLQSASTGENYSPLATDTITCNNDGMTNANNLFSNVEIWKDANVTWPIIFTIHFGLGINLELYNLLIVRGSWSNQKWPSKFTVEVSEDGENWFMVDDKSIPNPGRGNPTLLSNFNSDIKDFYKTISSGNNSASLSSSAINSNSAIVIFDKSTGAYGITSKQYSVVVTEGNAVVTFTESMASNTEFRFLII